MSYLETLFSMAGRVAIVTGAARGNGAAMAQALAGAGATVVLVDRRKRDLQRIAAGFRARRSVAVPVHADITDARCIVTLVDGVMRRFGRIDVLVNNAGVSFSGKLLRYPDDAWDRTYRVNLKAPFELARAVGRVMKAQRSGSIINITSLNAELAFPDNPAYVAFKGALRQLTRALALDLGAYGVRANNIGPGYFRTAMTEKSWKDPAKNRERRNRTVLGRWGEPRDLAGAVIFLASDASSYVTGQDIWVDGGWLIKGL